MNSVKIIKGPKNWQVLQQKNGYAQIELEGQFIPEKDICEFDDKHIIIRVVDEMSNDRILPPVKVIPNSEKWYAKINIPAGGPYRIETLVRFNKRWERIGDKILHLGVGDVYVIAGQSNAMGVGKDVIFEEIDINVHMFRYSGSWDIATHPLNDSTNSLFPLNIEKSQVGNSPWIAFAKKLNRNLGYPIGLIPTAVGGIPLSNWDRAEDGKHFNNMLEIVKKSGSDIKGILWYQGCTDAESNMASTYFERFKRVCTDFENEFYKDIPILTVQLNKIVCTKDRDVTDLGNKLCDLRSAQLKAKNEIKNVYMVPSIDCMVCDGIHNSSASCVVLGERVANMALKYVYGKEIICDAPEILGAFFENNRQIRLEFANVYDSIFSDLNCTENLMFRVTDKNGVISPIDYKCEGGNIVTLVFGRDIDTEAFIDCSGYNDTSLMPYDIYSYLPIVPFGKIRISEDYK